MPFVSEELYQRLPGRVEEDSIAVVSYPTGYSHWRNDNVCNEFTLFQEVVHGIRSVKKGFDLQKARPDVFVQCNGNNFDTVSKFCTEIGTLSLCTNVSMLTFDEASPQGTAMAPLNAHISLHIRLAVFIFFLC